MSAILLKSMERHTGYSSYGVAELLAIATDVHSQNIFHHCLKTLNKHLQKLLVSIFLPLILTRD